MSNLDFIRDLSPYMMSIKNIANYPNMSFNTHSRGNDSNNKSNINSSNKNNSTKNIIKPTDNIFYPKQKDNLFWCFYIALYGFDNYDTVSNFFTKEKEVKYAWIEDIRNRKEILKPIKISKSTVEDELANCLKVTMTTIKAMCHLFDINIFYIDNKKFYEISTNINKPVYVIEKKDQTYGLKRNLTFEQLDYYRNHFWKLENLDKPLKAISSYKINDLRAICSKIHIDCSNMTRPQMYQAILSYL